MIKRSVEDPKTVYVSLFGIRLIFRDGKMGRLVQAVRRVYGRAKE